MAIKLFRYGICEKEFISMAQLEQYAKQNIGVPAGALSAYGYTIREVKDNA